MSFTIVKSATARKAAERMIKIARDRQDRACADVLLSHRESLAVRWFGADPEKPNTWEMGIARMKGAALAYDGTRLLALCDVAGDAGDIHLSTNDAYVIRPYLFDDLGVAR